MITVGFLMVVAFIPFPTRLVAAADSKGRREGGDDRSTAITLTLTAASVQRDLVLRRTRRTAAAPDADPETVRGISKTFVFGPWLYLALTVVAAIDPVVGADRVRPVRALLGGRSSVFGRDRSHRSAER